MARALGGIALPTQIEWTDKDAWAPVIQEVEFTVGGTPYVHARARALGRDITLECRDGVEWMPAATLTSIKALANTVGGVYAFVWDAYTANVVFSHHSPPPFEFEPVFPHNADFFTGTIRLMTVT